MKTSELFDILEFSEPYWLDTLCVTFLNVFLCLLWVLNINYYDCFYNIHEPEWEINKSWRKRLLEGTSYGALILSDSKAHTPLIVIQHIFKLISLYISLTIEIVVYFVSQNNISFKYYMV